MSGRFTDSSGMPGIPLARALQAGDCLYAVDTCALARGLAVCARAIAAAPAPVLSAGGWLAAGLSLTAVAFVAMRRRTSARG